MSAEQTTGRAATSASSSASETAVAVFRLLPHYQCCLLPIEHSIGYVEYAYVLQNKMTFGQVQNKAGKFIKPDAASFQAAAASADWANTQDFYLIMTDAPGETAYPVAATVFMIMYKEPKDPARARTAREFFKWALEDGQKQANDLDYVPLPSSLVKQIESYWAAQFKS